MPDDLKTLRSLVMRMKDAGAPGLMVLQMLTAKASSQVGVSRSGRIGGSKARLIVVQSSHAPGISYLVIPGLFCSCPYFQTNVIKQGTDWTCKHVVRSTDSQDDLDLTDLVEDVYAQLRACLTFEFYPSDDRQLALIAISFAETFWVNRIGQPVRLDRLGRKDASQMRRM